MNTINMSEEINRRRFLGTAAMTLASAQFGMFRSAEKFSGKYSHRIIKGGVGHNLPQEARRPSPKL